MGRSRKIVVFLFFVITLFSCSKEEEVIYTTSMSLFNNTGYDIEIYKDKECGEILANRDYLRIIPSDSSNDFEKVSLERYFEDHGEKLKDISVYAVIDGERKFLKKWTFAGRNGDGKQLYRLSDSEIRVRHRPELSGLYIHFIYTFSIYPEDVGL